MRQRTSFAIITSQRTGSTLLVRSLDAVPEICCAGELFHTGSHVHHREFQYPHRILGSYIAGKSIDLIAQKWRVESHLARFYSEADPNARAVGFKFMVSQSRRFPSVLPWLARSGVQHIFLHRRDVFSTALSYCKARQSGVFHSDRASQTDRSILVEIEARDFEQTLEQCRKDKLAIIDLHNRFGGTLLAYEDMLSDWTQFISSIGSAIQLPDLTTVQALERVSSKASIVRIINEDWLRSAYADVSQP